MPLPMTMKSKSYQLRHGCGMLAAGHLGDMQSWVISWSSLHWVPPTSLETAWPALKTALRKPWDSYDPFYFYGVPKFGEWCSHSSNIISCQLPEDGHQRLVVWSWFRYTCPCSQENHTWCPHAFPQRWWIYWALPLNVMKIDLRPKTQTKRSTSFTLGGSSDLGGSPCGATMGYHIK